MRFMMMFTMMMVAACGVDALEPVGKTCARWDSTLVDVAPASTCTVGWHESWSVFGGAEHVTMDPNRSDQAVVGPVRYRRDPSGALMPVILALPVADELGDHDCLVIECESVPR